MNNLNHGAYYAADTRPLWQRLLSRLFPTGRVEIPEDLEGWAPSYMQTHTVCMLDWSAASCMCRPTPKPMSALAAAKAGALCGSSRRSIADPIPHR